MMNTMFMISGLGGAVIGATLVNLRWRRIAEERDYDAIQIQAFRVRELYDRADEEIRKRKKIETDAHAVVQQAREYIGDLLVRVNRQADIIERSRNKKIQKVIRLSKGWRVLLAEKIAAVISHWPGGEDYTKAAWESWPVYNELNA